MSTEVGNECKVCGKMFTSRRPSYFCSRLCRNRGAYQKAVAGGLCTACRDHPARPGMKTCGVCKYTDCSGENSYYRQRISRGVCVICGKAAFPGKTTCAACAQTALARANRTRSGRIEAGLCRKCGRVGPVPGLVHCAACLATRRVARMRLKQEVFAAYGGSTCRCCKVSEPAFLTIDHVNGGGGRHRREIGGVKMAGGKFYRWLKGNGFPSGFQVLCFNCNIAKYQLGRCPHQS